MLKQIELFGLNTL